MTTHSIQEIEEAVVVILARQLLVPVAEIDPNAPIDDLGLDSLGRVEAIFALEEHFDIAIPFNANQDGSPEFDLSTAHAIAQGVLRLIRERIG